MTAMLYRRSFTASIGSVASCLKAGRFGMREVPCQSSKGSLLGLLLVPDERWLAPISVLPARRHLPRKASACIHTRLQTW